MRCSKIQEKFEEGGNELQGMFYFVNIYAAEVFIFCVGIDFTLKSPSVMKKTSARKCDLAKWKLQIPYMDPLLRII